MLFRINTNTTGLFDRKPQLIVVVGTDISEIIGDTHIYISEFIIAKVKGKIPEHNGHPEVTDEIFMKISESLSVPQKIIRDTRHNQKFLFINNDPLHEIVVEVSRQESGVTEINTIHIIDIQELKRLERKFPVLLALARPQ